MTGRKKHIWAGVGAVFTIAAVLTGATTQGKSFGFLDPAFTQQLFAATPTNNGAFYLGGVAVLPSGDLIATECVSAGTRLHRFSSTATFTKHDTLIHVETILPSAGGCGVVFHRDGTLYLNMNDGVHGVANVNPTTGSLIRFLGTPGNAVGIAVDPVTNHIVYADKNCVAASATNCILIDLDTVTGATTNRMVFPMASVKFVNGIYFEPTGAFLFLSNRFPIPRVTVVTRAGVIVQHLDTAGSDPVGIGFRATSPKFVVTNNTDGSMSRFDFPGDDYTQVPVPGVLALFGHRGDLMQAGPDGCLYVTQGGARYDDGTDEPGSRENSLAQICGGFAPPPGVPMLPAKTTMTTTATSTQTAGGAIQDSAALSGGRNPTGTISFSVYGPDDARCSGTATPAGSATVTGNGTYLSTAVTETAAGTYRWIARYSGDANNAGFAGACGATGETSTVTKASPLVTTDASASVPAGGQIFDTAHLTGGVSPTGAITFTLYGPDNANCSGTPAFTGSVAVSGNGDYRSASLTADQAGTYRWIATYSGDVSNAARSTRCNDPNESSQVTPPLAGKVTGGGQVAPVQGGRASFGYIAQRHLDGGSATGHFDYVNHATGLHINGPVTSLFILGPTSARFSGTWGRRLYLHGLHGRQRRASGGQWRPAVGVVYVPERGRSDRRAITGPAARQHPDAQD